jgi:hypothetical protein
MSGSLTSRWLSSLRPLNQKLSFTDATSVTGFFDSPGPFHPPRRPSVSSSVQSSPKIVLPQPLPELTHGTPFASQTYIPPTGAPGFEGDRAWNKSHFEFGPESKVPRKSIILKGRKDMTSIVLTPSLADLVSWSLPGQESSEPLVPVDPTLSTPDTSTVGVMDFTVQPRSAWDFPQHPLCSLLNPPRWFIGCHQRFRGRSIRHLAR